MMKTEYFDKLKYLFSKIQANDKTKAISFEKAISQAISISRALKKKRNKIILIGNGGSASIASHIATDFLKNASIPAIAFNDSSLLTCLSNDLGYEYVFERPLGMLAQRGDLLFSISSSGKSKNILNAVLKARKNSCFIITLSGFSEDNPLRKMGDLNFYVPSYSYGEVEIVHLAICHCVVDALSKVLR